MGVDCRQYNEWIYGPQSVAEKKFNYLTVLSYPEISYAPNSSDNQPWLANNSVK